MIDPCARKKNKSLVQSIFSPLRNPKLRNQEKNKDIFIFPKMYKMTDCLRNGKSQVDNNLSSTIFKIIWIIMYCRYQKLVKGSLLYIDFYLSTLNVSKWTSSSAAFYIWKQSPSASPLLFRLPADEFASLRVVSQRHSSEELFIKNP